MWQKRVLLIQVRDRGDVMAEHELACVVRRLEGRGDVDVKARNALTEPADRSWLDGYDAVIFGGSGDYSVHHSASQPWVSHLRHTLDAILERKLPGFGICFGHQLLGMHLGATVVTDENFAEVGTVPVELTHHGGTDTVFSALERQFVAQTGHSDHVTTVPPGCVLLASNETLETQAFRVLDAPFYSTQFHPDLTAFEAVSRYTAYQQALSGSVPDPARVERFRVGVDATAHLLRRFLDQAVTEPGAESSTLNGADSDQVVYRSTTTVSDQ